MTQKSIAIVGPTASGKSGIAIRIAQKFHSEIISADSRQIFRYMDIGTGKVPCDFAHIPSDTPRILRPCLSSGIAHYMIDVVAPTTPYNVAKFVKNAQKIRAHIWQKKKLPIIAGGTLFWAQALIENQTFPEILPDKSLRAQLKNASATELFAQLKQLDNARAQEIAQKNEHNNRARLIRAIEIAQNPLPPNNSTPITTQNTVLQNTPPLIIAINPPKEILHQNIAQRFDEWIRDGILNEIIALHRDHHVTWARMESFGLEYKWCSRYVRKMVGFDEMRTNAIRDIRKYAKRQMTWLRRWERHGATIHWITRPHDAIEIAQNYLKNRT